MKLKIMGVLISFLYSLSACVAATEEMGDAVQSEEKAAETGDDGASAADDQPSDQDAQGTQNGDDATEPKTEETPQAQSGGSDEGSQPDGEATEQDQEVNKPESSAASAKSSTDGDLYVTTSGLNVRSGPGMSYEVVRVLGFREQVTDLGREGNWVRIGDGQYVYSRYLTSAVPDAPNDPVVNSDVKPMDQGTDEGAAESSGDQDEETSAVEQSQADGPEDKDAAAAEDEPATADEGGSTR